MTYRDLKIIKAQRGIALADDIALIALIGIIGAFVGLTIYKYADVILAFLGIK